MWFDRLTQTSLKKLPSSIESGRFQWTGINEECLNKHSSIRPNDILVSDSTENCQLNSGSFKFIKSVAENDANAELITNAINTIGNLQANNCSKLISPLLPAAVINNESHLLPLEKILEEVLKKGHLHKISTNPRIDIQYTEEVIDVARARRLGKGALVHLASHSECWQRQTLSGIVPKKVKAQLSEDDFQIYENRVYSRLLDKLERHLSKRLKKIIELESTLQKALNFNGKNQVNYRVSHRIFEVWGETFDGDKTKEVLGILGETHDSLEHMLRTITGLKQSGLYLKIPRHSQVGQSLHRTNILSHDSHYRHLAILWDNLLRDQNNHSLSPSEFYERSQTLAENYAIYAGIVIQKSLQPYIRNTDIGFKRDLLEIPWAGSKLVIKRINFDWTISYKPENGGLEELLRIVPFFSTSDNESDITDIDSSIIIARPTIKDIDPSRALSGASQNLITLSPLDLYCVERMGLLLDKTLNLLLHKNYAKPILKIPTSVKEYAVGLDNEALQIDKVQSPSLRLLAELDDKELDTILKLLQKSNAKNQALELSLRNEEVKALRTCPVCYSLAKINHQPDGGFSLICPNCSSNQYLTISGGKHFFSMAIDKTETSNFIEFGRWATNT